MNKLKPHLALAGGLAMLSLGACSGSESDFADVLQENSNIPADVAECMAELAEEELSDDARAFLMASMQSDDDKVSEMRSELSMSELAAAGAFMVSSATRCGANLE